MWCLLLQAFPVLLGDTDLHGNVSATFIHQFGARLRTKLQAQVAKSELAVAQATTEYRGRLGTASLTVANLDLVNQSGVVVAQVNKLSYLRSSMLVYLLPV